MQANTFPPGFKPKLLEHKSPTDRRYFILDTNIANYLFLGKDGQAISRLNDSLSKWGLVTSDETAFCMTPFQLVELLGTKLPDVIVEPKHLTGDTAAKIVGRTVDEARRQYRLVPELEQAALEQRAKERRSYIPEQCLDLFDICVLYPSQKQDLTNDIAEMLAWDHALKSTYPKKLSEEVERFLMSLLLTSGGQHISRFRIVKRLWDRYYRRAIVDLPSHASEINKLNKAMRLKSRRDFLDCDLVHLASFGWLGDDVLVFTCDPPESVLGRLTVYKSMIGAVPTELSPNKLPLLSHGMIICCSPEGEITHIFPVNRVPVIV